MGLLNEYDGRDWMSMVFSLIKNCNRWQCDSTLAVVVRYCRDFYPRELAKTINVFGDLQLKKDMDDLVGHFRKGMIGERGFRHINKIEDPKARAELMETFYFTFRKFVNRGRH